MVAILAYNFVLPDNFRKSYLMYYHRFPDFRKSSEPEKIQ